MILLDTSLIISFFNDQDVLHSKAVEKFKEFEKENVRLAMSDYILNEAITVMLRRRGLEKSKEMLDFLLNYKRLEVFHLDERGFFEVIEQFKNQTDMLSFVDCSILWMVKIHGFDFATFDKNLIEQIGKIR